MYRSILTPTVGAPPLKVAKDVARTLSPLANLALPGFGSVLGLGLDAAQAASREIAEAFGYATAAHEYVDAPRAPGDLGVLLAQPTPELPADATPDEVYNYVDGLLSMPVPEPSPVSFFRHSPPGKHGWKKEFEKGCGVGPCPYLGMNPNDFLLNEMSWLQIPNPATTAVIYFRSGALETSPEYPMMTQFGTGTVDGSFNDNVRGAIVVPVSNGQPVPLMTILTTSFDYLMKLVTPAMDCRVKYGDPIINKWLSYEKLVMRYVGGTPFERGALTNGSAPIAKGPRQMELELYQALAQNAGCKPQAQRAQQRAAQQPAAPGACESGQFFRGMCVPAETAEYCAAIGGQITAKVGGDGKPHRDSDIYCRPPMQKRDIVTKVAQNVYMVQPRINPLGGRPSILEPVGSVGAPVVRPLRTTGGAVRFGNGGITALRPF